MKKLKFTVLIEKGKNSYGAHIKNLPGCVAVVSTKAEVKRLMKGCVKMHLESMLNDKERIPNPNNYNYSKEDIFNVELIFKDAKSNNN